jgi:hypothetical protein
MAYQNDNTNYTPRPKIDISALGITCTECGTPINELPFEPTKRDDGTYGRLFCYECNKKRNRDRGPRSFGGGSRGGFGGGRRDDRRF